jgi:hypothetical protein
MSPLEIVLIIIGIVIIAISCRLVDQSGKATNQQTAKAFSIENSITEEDKKQLIQKMNDMLSDISEETVIRTDDSLSKLSNEKIMAVNEFSDQILEKIKRNHEEVVFLYNMLSDKEKELKAAVKEIDSSKKKVQEILESKVSSDKSQSVKNVKTQLPEKPTSPATRTDKPMNTMSNQTEVTQNLPTLNSLSSNSNTQILALHSQGKSVMEISKLLGLGQGEVKLVIDLFKGKK